MYILIVTMNCHAFALIKTRNVQNEYLNLSLTWNFYNAGSAKKNPEPRSPGFSATRACAAQKW